MIVDIVVYTYVSYTSEMTSLLEYPPINTVTTVEYVFIFRFFFSAQLRSSPPPFGNCHIATQSTWSIFTDSPRKIKTLA